MKIYVVSREGHAPEGAFESLSLAQDYIKDRVIESEDRGHEVVGLDVVKHTDRQRADAFGVQGRMGTVFNE